MIIVNKSLFCLIIVRYFVFYDWKFIYYLWKCYIFLRDKQKFCYENTRYLYYIIITCLEVNDWESDVRDDVRIARKI